MSPLMKPADTCNTFVPGETITPEQHVHGRNAIPDDKTCDTSLPRMERGAKKINGASINSPTD